MVYVNNKNYKEMQFDNIKGYKIAEEIYKKFNALQTQNAILLDGIKTMSKYKNIAVRRKCKQILAEIAKIEESC